MLRTAGHFLQPAGTRTEPDLGASGASTRPTESGCGGRGRGGWLDGCARGSVFRAARYRYSDRLAYPLGVHREGKQSWIHPHIYDWPADGSEEREAGLPLLNWKENLAAKVVEEVLENWTRRSRELGIGAHYSVADLSMHSLASGHLLRWNGDQPESLGKGRSPSKTWGLREGRRMRVQSFDIVILAVGFGVEEPTPKFLEIDSYWSADKIDEEDRTTSRPRRRVLVSGNGDGGLIDALRYSFRSFRHESVLRELRPKSGSRPKNIRVSHEECSRLKRRHPCPNRRPCNWSISTWNTEDWPTLW